MDKKEFTEKMKEKGYEVKRQQLNNNPLDDALIVSEDNFYHVAIHSQEILKAPFDFLSSYVEREIVRLRESEVS